jgi:hypothetical protein
MTGPVFRPSPKEIGEALESMNSHGQPADRPGKEPTYEDRSAIFKILSELDDTLYRAMKKHAAMHSPHEGLSVLQEEVKELRDHVYADTGRTPEARKEALQVAAMAIRYVVDLIDTEKNDGR